jgi:nucleoside-diphosphate-sugar epimerase
VIINCAASIDFNARIDFAIDSNIRGSLRMLDLAKKVKKLEIFTHISTCYVNCNLKGLIKE